MANKNISQLDAASSVQLADLFVLEQSGTAKKLTGQTLLNNLAAELAGHGGISSIAKTGTSGLVDTYTITFADTTTTTFTVTNGKSISSIAKTGTSGLVDTYTITYSDGNTATFTVTNGNGISSIAKTGTSGLVDTYTITFTNGNTATFTVTNGSEGAAGDDAYIHFKWAAQMPTQDSDISDTPNSYLGVCANHSVNAPTDYTQYTWMYARGADGAQGIQGEPGHSGAVPWRSTAAPTESSGTYSFDMTYVSRGAGIVGDVPAAGDILFYQDTYYSVIRIHINALTGTTYVDCNNPYQFTGGGGGTSDYTQLSNKPSINSVTLSGNKTSDDLNIKEPFYATVGTTTVAQIDAAWTAGKVIFCKTSDGTEILPLEDREDSTEYVFRGISAGNTLVFRTCDSNGWSSTTISVPTPQSSGTPENLGTASRGSATTASRSDHVHPMPTAADVGASPAITEVTVSTAGSVTQALDAGKIYHFTGALTALTITLNAAASGQIAHYHFDFNCGSTAPTVTIPNTVTMPDSNSFEASKHYEVDILNNYGVVLSWANS